MAARKKTKAIKLGEHSGPLRLIAFSDWRVQDLGLLAEELSKFPTKPDLILYGGDDVPRFRESDRNLFEDLGRLSRYGICAVAGNDDMPSVRTLISGDSVHNVHVSPVIVGEYAVLGLDGAPTAPGYIVHSEKEISRHLAVQRRAVSRKKIVLVSHAPPFGTLDKAVRFSPDGQPRSIGSQSLRKFIRSNKRVTLVICGHVHRLGGRHERLGRALVVNAASHDYLGNVGRFAVITVSTSGKAKVEWREIVEVACIAGVKERSAEKLRAAGIRTAQELADAPVSLLAATLPHPPRPIEVLKARARALVERRPILIRPLELPIEPEIFIDIETDSAGGCNYVWLIGFCVGRKGPYQAFFAETAADEQRILNAFAEFAARQPTANFLAFSSSKLEERALQAGFSRHGLSTPLCSRIVNLCHRFQRSVALPINSESGKEIATMLGFRYRHPALDGLRVALLYERNYTEMKNANRRKALKRRILEYNEDDVRSLPFILDAVANLSTPIAVPKLFPSAEEHTA